MEVLACFEGSRFDIEIVHDYEDVVSVTSCESEPVPGAFCGSSYAEVVEDNATDDVHTLDGCEQCDEEEDPDEVNLDYLHMAAICIDNSVQIGLDAEATISEKMSNVAREGYSLREEIQESEMERKTLDRAKQKPDVFAAITAEEFAVQKQALEAEEAMLELERHTPNAAASTYFVGAEKSWVEADGQESGVSTHLPEDATIEIPEVTLSAAASAEAVVEPPALQPKQQEAEAAVPKHTSEHKPETATAATLATSKTVLPMRPDIKKETGRPQMRRKAAAQHPPQLQTGTQTPAVTHEEIVPVPPSHAPLAVPMAPSEPLSPRSPAGNLRNQLRCFRIHTKSTCEPPTMPRTGSSSSLADLYETLGAVEFHCHDIDHHIAPSRRKAPLAPGRRIASVGEQPATFLGMPEPTMSAVSMDLGEDAVRKRIGSAGSSRCGTQSHRLSSSVGPLAPVRLPSQSHTRQTPTWLTTGLDVGREHYPSPR